MNELLKGKVKTVYDTEDAEKVLIEFHDKVTAGNGELVEYPPEKGATCCLISALLFEMLEKRGIKTHYLELPSLNKMICRKLTIVPLEVICRNIAAGSIVKTTTLTEGTLIQPPIVEFFLKDDSKNDPLLTQDRIIQMGYNMEDVGEMEIMAREVNLLIQNIFDEIGLTLVDIKFEFGYDVNKKLLLADELSPDGMRIWKDGKSFDKDLFRNDEGDLMVAYRYILEELKRVTK